MSAPYRAPSSRPGLSSHRHANVAYVVTVVESPNRNRVFAGAGDRQVKRITLALAVSNSVIRKHFMPRPAIDADFRTFDATRGVFNIKHCANAVAGDLGRRCRAHDRRRIVDIYRLADPLSLQRGTPRVVR